MRIQIITKFTPDADYYSEKTNGVIEIHDDYDGDLVALAIGVSEDTAYRLYREYSGQ